MQGDRVQTVFNVTAGAFIQLGVNGIIAPLGQPASGVTGTHVSVEGSSFLLETLTVVRVRFRVLVLER